MGRFFRAVKAGVRGAAAGGDPARFQAAGIVLICQHCRGDLFRRRTALLNTATLSAMGIDWMDRSGAALVCESCGLIHRFLKEPQRVDG